MIKATNYICKYQVINTINRYPTGTTFGLQNRHILFYKDLCDGAEFLSLLI